MEAKPATLIGPPPLLERIVLASLPPAVRESVGGDLCEMYRSPWQYGVQAAAALPFVVLSQARRNANLPVLGLQGLVLFAFFSALFAIADIAKAYAVPATAAGVAVLLLHEAYRSQERLSCRRATIETILLSAVVSLLFPQQVLMTPALRQSVSIWWPGFALLGTLMIFIPVLCCIRGGLILEVDRRHPPEQRENISPDDVPQDYRRFRQQAFWRNRLEGAALLIAAICFALLGGRLGAPGSMATGMLIGAYVCAALYMLLDGAAPAAPPAPDFLSLRALFQIELARRHQLRRFLWWLWSAPLFLFSYTGLIMPGIADGQTTEVTLGFLAVLLLGFFISALNREGAGPIQEKIVALAGLEPPGISTSWADY